jgi:hypothetical protein
MFSAFDHTTAGAAYARPGMDTRQWVSHGTVDPETPDQKSVTFTKAYGPLVSVTLQPSGVPCVCRVAHEVAGNGEGEWFPFIAGDEVIVVIPEGDETAGCVIVGRLNQEIDQWPQVVAGQDATKNNFAFRRMRTPYIIETASGWMVRHATTGAFFGLSPEGALTFSNSDKAFMAIRPDFIGFQNGDATVLLQIDVGASQIVAEAAGTHFVLDKLKSSIYTLGTLELGTAGNQASEHATSIESVLLLLQAFFAAVGIASPGPLTGAALAGLAIAQLNVALPAAAILPIAPYTAALTPALSIPKVAGVTPGIASPGLLI